MKKSFKKAISLVLCLIMMVTLCGSAFAAKTGLVDANITDDEIVLLDVYDADHYKMASYLDSDTAWVVTVFEDDRIEVASSPLDGTGIVHSLWLSTDELDYETRNASAELGNNNAFAQALKEYSLNNMDKSEEIIISQSHPTNTIQRSTGSMQKAAGTDDYNALMDQLAAIHGSPHVDYNWTGLTSQYYGGYTLNYKEILDYGMTYRDSYAFNLGTTLGGIVAGIIGLIGLTVPMAIIAAVLGVAAATNTILDHAGMIASYYGDAVYSRYVMVNGEGPYYECSKMTYYEGWVEEGMNDSARLVNEGTVYSTTSQIFGSYTMQRERALENY